MAHHPREQPRVHVRSQLRGVLLKQGCEGNLGGALPLALLLAVVLFALLDVVVEATLLLAEGLERAEAPVVRNDAQSSVPSHVRSDPRLCEQTFERLLRLLLRRVLALLGVGLEYKRRRRQSRSRSRSRNRSRRLRLLLCRRDRSGNRSRRHRLPLRGFARRLELLRDDPLALLRLAVVEVDSTVRWGLELLPIRRGVGALARRHQLRWLLPSRSLRHLVEVVFSSIWAFMLSPLTR
mmetsp:Transcript_17617/g.57571  ORF Transcript_17617/g.57571 Transcript_17617/m.57571 type:complete len:237 (+) Transcript_17617:1086-1796(+)